MADLIMTIREVATALKLAEKTVYAMAAEGDLPSFKIRGHWRVRRVDFEAWLSRQAGVGAAPKRSGEPNQLPLSDEFVGALAPPLYARADQSEQRPLGELTERISQEQMHRRLVEALGPSVVRAHADLDAKPFHLDLAPPLPQRLRVYMYNATRPPGGRPLGEHKIQLIVPGQSRGQRGSLDNTDGRIVLLVGYAAEEDIFILWDAGLYSDFAFSRNVQVKAETIIQASAGKLATQVRQLRPASGPAIIETVVAAGARRLAEAIAKRMELTRERLLRE